jgi:hypothetical protein
MEVVRDLMVIVEALVPIDLLITIQIVQDHDLVPAGDMDSSPQELHSQGLKQARGNSVPGDWNGLWTVPARFCGERIEPGHLPNAPIPGADDGGVASVCEIKAREP